MGLRKRRSVHCEYGSRRAWTLAARLPLPPPHTPSFLFPSILFSASSIVPSLTYTLFPFRNAIAHTTPATMAEPDDKAPRFSSASYPNRASFDEASPGAARIGAVAEHLTINNRACILFGVLLAAWAYGLDNTLRGSYQSIAANALNANVQLATITVVRAVIGAATQVCRSPVPNSRLS